MSYNSKYTGAEVEALLDAANGKQDKIEDLDAIRSGAAAGATALQSVPSEYVTETELKDKGYATTYDLDGKVDKISGKQLSTEDFTTALKEKLEGLSNYNDAEISNAVSSLQTQLDTLVSGDANDAINSFNEIIAFLDGVKDTQDLEGIIASIETQIAAKQATISDLDTIRAGAALGATALQSETYKGTVTGVKINNTTKNPSNGVVDLGTVITAHQDISGKADKSSLATVATSGSYNDLSNKPTIPSEQVNADWNATSGKAQILNKPTIPAAVTESTVSGWGFTKNTGTYSKPSGGIPKTDLASDVQLSLSKADDALQEQRADENYIKKNVWDDLVVAEADGFFSNKAGLHFALPNTNNGDEDDVLLSRESVKTINGESILGSGDIDTRPYITNFSYEELQSIGNKQISVQNELIYALREQRPILVPMSLTSDLGYYHASGYVEDLMYLTIYGDYGVVYYLEVDYTSSLALYPSNVIRKEFQNKLVSGTNIKSINGESILGGGDIEIGGSSLTESDIAAMGFTKNTGTYSKPSTGIPKSDLASAVQTSLGKADTALQSYTEQYKGTVTGVKINGTTKSPSSGVVDLGTVITSHQDISGKQDKLVSGTNIKTVNGTSLLGSGNIAISGGSGTITGVSANGTSIATSGVANIPAASTSAYGVTKLSSATNSTSTSLAATASAVKAAYDLANNYKGTVTGVKVNGSTKTPSSGTVDIGNVVTSIKINGSTKTPSNGVVDLGTISGGGSSSGGSGAYAEVNHGTSDTTFTLTPNTFHVWDEVGALTLTLGSETAGVANEYLFQFTSGATATSLTLPDGIKWVNDSVPTISENMIYQISVLNGMAVALEFNNAVQIVEFTVNGQMFIAIEGMTWEEFINSEYNSGNFVKSGTNVSRFGNLVGINQQPVLLSDSIINGMAYGHITGGSGGAD